MLSVGGATYSWATYNAKSIAAFASDLGVDGIDIDMEEANLASKLGNIIDDIKKEWKGLVSIAAFSVGAYGNGKYTNSPPASQYTGMNISGIKQSGDKLDFINLMAYDAGTTFNNEEAYNAYRDIYKGPIYIGQEVDPAAWGGVIVNENTVKIDAAKAEGIFVWSYQKVASSGPSTIQIINAANTIYKQTVSTPVTLPPVFIPAPVVPPTPKKQKPHKTTKPSTTPLWKNDTKYNVGDKVKYETNTYICRMEHTSQMDWVPSQYTQALWTLQYFLAE